MGFLSLLFGEGAAAAGEAIAKPIDAVGQILDKAFTTDDERLTHAEIMAKLQDMPDADMRQVLMLDAKSSFWFQANWRPAIGWVCVVSLASYYPPRFIVATVLWTLQVINKGEWINPPEVGVADILGLVGTLMGMATLRTAEKSRGITSRG
jgi:Protein of unknown function (DUF3154).